MIRNSDNEFRLRWVILALVLFAYATIKTEELYIANYDTLAPNCEARETCPTWFMIIGLLCILLPIITAILLIITVMRVICLAVSYCNLIKDYFKKMQGVLNDLETQSLVPPKGK